MFALLIIAIVVWGYAVFSRRLLRAIVNKTSAGLMLGIPEEDESAGSGGDITC